MNKYIPKKGSRYLSFIQARKYVRQFKLKTTREWRAWRKNKPKFIPSSPNLIYKAEWRGFNDFLGNGKVILKDRKLYSFEKARSYVHKQNLKGTVEWREWAKNKRPTYIPNDPKWCYSKDWINWQDWLGFEVGFWSFDKAREYVRKRKLSNFKEYMIWSKTSRPKCIPSQLPKHYSREWKGYQDFFGDHYLKGFLPFKEARAYVRKMKIENSVEWREWSKKSRPPNIPSNPDKAFPGEFIDWSDWLGAPGRSGGFLSFKDARKYMHKENLKNDSDWREWKKTNRPTFIPGSPSKFYRDEWNGISDWLGYGKRKYYSYSQASWYVKKQKLKNFKEWREWRKTKRPHFIPSTPEKIYSKEWNGIAAFIGTNISKKNSPFLRFKEARKIVRILNLKSHVEWWEWSKSKRPNNIPSYPPRVYKDEFINWLDWFGK